MTAQADNAIRGQLREALEQRDEYRREWEAACERANARPHIERSALAEMAAALRERDEWRARAERLRGELAELARAIVDLGARAAKAGDEIP